MSGNNKAMMGIPPWAVYVFAICVLLIIICLLLDYFIIRKRRCETSTSCLPRRSSKRTSRTTMKRTNVVFSNMQYVEFFTFSVLFYVQNHSLVNITKLKVTFFKKKRFLYYERNSGAMVCGPLLLQTRTELRGSSLTASRKKFEQLRIVLQRLKQPSACFLVKPQESKPLIDFLTYNCYR